MSSLVITCFGFATGLASADCAGAVVVVVVLSEDFLSSGDCDCDSRAAAFDVHVGKSV